MKIDIVEKYDYDNFDNKNYEKLEYEEVNKIIDKSSNDFKHQIIKRGEEYYAYGNIISVIKSIY